MTSSIQGWKTYRLGDLAEYVNGRAFKPIEWKRSGLPIIRIQNLTDSEKPFNYCDKRIDRRFLVSNGDLLVSWSATLGSYIWNRGPAALNQHIFKVLPNADLVEKEFLHYLMLNILDEIAEHSHGLAMKHITKKKFDALEVSVPNLAVQRRIVAWINKCMERIDEIEGIGVTSLAEANAVFPSVLNSIFESLPSSTRLSTIGDLALETRYGTSRKCHVQLHGLPILRIPNVASGSINFDDMKYCDLSAKEIGHTKLADGDLLFVRTNGSRDLVGRCAVFTGHKSKQKYGFASYLIRVRLDTDKVLPRYVAYFLNSTKGREEIDKRRRTSAGQFNINSENLRSISLPVPSIADQTRLLISIEQREAMVDRLLKRMREKVEERANLREAILQKAFARQL